MIYHHRTRGCCCRDLLPAWSNRRGFRWALLLTPSVFLETLLFLSFDNIQRVGIYSCLSSIHCPQGKIEAHGLVTEGCKVYANFFSFLPLYPSQVLTDGLTVPQTCRPLINPSLVHALPSTWRTLPRFVTSSLVEVSEEIAFLIFSHSSRHSYRLFYILCSPNSVVFCVLAFTVLHWNMFLH